MNHPFPMNTKQKKYLWENYRELEPNDIFWFKELLEEKLSLGDELHRLCSIYKDKKSKEFTETKALVLKIDTLIQLIKLK